MEILRKFAPYFAAGLIFSALGSFGVHKYMQAKYGEKSSSKISAILFGGLVGLVAGVNAAGLFMRMYNENAEKRLYPGTKAHEEKERDEYQK